MPADSALSETGMLMIKYFIGVSSTPTIPLLELFNVHSTVAYLLCDINVLALKSKHLY